MSYKKQQKDGLGWLIFFYSVPSKPVNARVRIWRKLTKAGALPFKGAVYILPYTEEHYELMQWLVSEVTSLGGEGAFVRAKNIETLNDEEIIALFNQQRERDYHGIEKRVEELERRLNSIRKGGGTKDQKRLSEEFEKCAKEFGEVKTVDFFTSIAGDIFKQKLNAVQLQIRGLSDIGARTEIPVITRKQIGDYQNKTWVTRKKPFVDRMASAWLIKRFIDKNASFQFIDEKDMEKAVKQGIAFDMRGGEFTHTGDMCTFEVIVKAFNFKDSAFKKIAEIVHELDVKDDKHRNPEAKGIEEILTGIRKTAEKDSEALEKGMAVFEMLYASKI